MVCLCKPAQRLPLTKQQGHPNIFLIVTSGCCVLRACFEDEIKRRFRRPAKTGESSSCDDFAQTGLPGLSAQAKAALFVANS